MKNVLQNIFVFLSKYKLALIIILSCIQLSVISFQILDINHKSEVAGISVSPLSRQNLIFEPNKKLKYFFEPRPNQVLKHTQPWLDSEGISTINQDNINSLVDYTIEKKPQTLRIITLGPHFRRI